MALTELDRLRHAYIGELGVSGLSVEQRKRLTLAVELVANPSVVFMGRPAGAAGTGSVGLGARQHVRGTVRAPQSLGSLMVLSPGPCLLLPLPAVGRCCCHPQTSPPLGWTPAPPAS